MGPLSWALSHGKYLSWWILTLCIDSQWQHTPTDTKLFEISKLVKSLFKHIIVTKYLVECLNENSDPAEHQIVSPGFRACWIVTCLIRLDPGHIAHDTCITQYSSHNTMGSHWGIQGNGNHIRLHNAQCECLVLWWKWHFITYNDPNSKMNYL